MLLRALCCVISKVYACCGPAYRPILLTRSLNNKKKTVPLTLDQVLVGQWRSLFICLKIAKCQQCTWAHLVFRAAGTWAHKWAQMHLIFKQRGAGCENDNCVALKLQHTHTGQRVCVYMYVEGAQCHSHTLNTILVTHMKLKYDININLTTLDVTYNPNKHNW